MTADETAGYTRHHLTWPDATTPACSPDAITQIHDAARGKPRAVNNLTIAALIAASAAGKTVVDHADARAAVADVITTDSAPRRHHEHEAPPRASPAASDGCRPCCLLGRSPLEQGLRRRRPRRRPPASHSVCGRPSR